MEKRDKKYFGGLGLAAVVGTVIAMISLCDREKQKDIRLNPETYFNSQQNLPAVVVTPQTKNIYTVKQGDYLSKIVQKELGLTGRDIYDKCLEIQVDNNLGSERDISKVVDGELVPGKDGFVDLLYPGEELLY